MFMLMQANQIGAKIKQAIKLHSSKFVPLTFDVLFMCS